MISFQDAKTALFSPTLRMRQESVSGFQKDRALEEVFRLTPRPDTLRTTRRSVDRRQTENTVSNWMDHQGEMPSPPQEQDRSVVDRLEMRKQARKATLLRQRAISGTRSIASDPADFMVSSAFNDHFHSNEAVNDGDDELNTHDDDGAIERESRLSHSHVSSSHKEDADGYFVTPRAHLSTTRLSSTASSRKTRFPDTIAPPGSSPPRRRPHIRNMSTNTSTSLFPYYIAGLFMGAPERELQKGELYQNRDLQGQ